LYDSVGGQYLIIRRSSRLVGVVKERYVSKKEANRSGSEDVRIEELMIQREREREKEREREEREIYQGICGR